MTPEEIVDNWGDVTLAQVYAALAYYHANRDEIEQSLQQDEEEYDRLCADEPLTPNGTAG